MASPLGLLVTVACLSLQGCAFQDDEEAQGVSVPGELNVYDEDMTDCGVNHASGCTYTAMDAGAHQVCVRKLPVGFSSDTGQGSWSDEYKGEPWCICIWAYSNYILQNKDLALKCESIPAKVLEERYSMAKFKQCGKMSSTEGCGAEDIRRSIESLCQQCDEQAGNQASKKNALSAKCKSILSSAPAAPMQQLDNESSTAKAAMEPQTSSPTSPFIFAGFAVAIVLGVAALQIRNTRRRQMELRLFSMDTMDPEILMVNQ